MKNLYFLRPALLLWVAAIFYTCSKDDPTPLEKYRIQQAHIAIDSLARADLLSADPVQGFKQHLAQIQALPGVESAKIDGIYLSVKYEKGGSEVWAHYPPIVVPPYVELTKNDALSHAQHSVEDRGNPGLVGNQRVCLINQQFNDEGRNYNRNLITYLQNSFTDKGFQADVFNGESANLDFFSSQFSSYATVFYISHGGNIDGLTWVLTGQEVKTFADELLEQHYLDWESGKIAAFNVDELRGGARVQARYFAISSNFISDRYSSPDAFPNTLCYLVACQGLKSTDFAEALHSKGCQSIVGWTETNCQGQASGKLLFQHLLGGRNVAESFSAMPSEALHDECSGEDADLEFYPAATGGEAFLFPDTAQTLPIYITSVTNGQIISSRTVSIRGYIKDAQSLTSAILEVNGNAVKLEYDGSFQFDQNIDITSGNNVVRITATGTHINGRPASGQTSVNLTGNFPPLALWTKLRWNTDYADVDLHLLPPGATYDDLFSNGTDCYFDYQDTWWNGHLDVDDVDGWGPEHIVIPSSPSSGIYTLVVHYWQSWGSAPPDAFVSVETQGYKWESASLPLANSFEDTGAGDAYAVCTIEFPSGKITPLQQRIATPRSSQMLNIHKPARPDKKPLRR